MKKLLPIFIVLGCTVSLFSCKGNPTGPSVTGLPTEGLLAYYPFNGDAFDSSGNQHNGTLNGGITWVTDRFGHPSGACHFDGTSAYITIGDSAGDLNFNVDSQSYTISCWVRLDTLVSNRDM